jgi:hypothetical protein
MSQHRGLITNGISLCTIPKVLRLLHLFVATVVFGAELLVHPPIVFLVKFLAIHVSILHNNNNKNNN